MSHKRTDEIVRRKPFDLQEAVILLDVYLSHYKTGASNAEASEVASLRLRKLAQDRGMLIDDSFRSAMGIQNRLRSIGNIFEGKESPSAPGTQIFREAVDLYRNDNGRYIDMLHGQTSIPDAPKRKKRKSSVKKTKFVRTKKDQDLKKAYGDAFNRVYYALKSLSSKASSGLTATALFESLDHSVKRKDIIVILENASWSKKIKDAHYVFYDKEQEERKKKQMEDSIKASEQEFFSWLPSAVSPSVLEEIKKSYRTIGAILVQKKSLSQSLFATSQIGQVEDALRLSKKVFGSKKTRNTAQKLLTAYVAYLREKKNTVSSTKQSQEQEIDVQADWIRFDFTNAQQFEYTVPAYVSVKGQQFEARNWARILVGITEQELNKKNPALESLYKESLISNRKDRPFFLKKKLEGLNCSELSNGYWINVNYSIPRLMDQIRALCLHCGYTKSDVVIYGVDRSSARTKSTPAKPKVSGHAVNIEKAEAFLKEAGLQGTTIQELIDKVQPGAAVFPTRNAMNSAPQIITMPGDRFVHSDAFVDLDEAEEEMEKILNTHFAQFGGYSNNKLLFGAASHDLSLFLNDNDCEDVDSVYSLAQYFFAKKKPERPFTFSYPHIFRDKPDFPLTLKGLMINLARTNGGVLNAEDAKNYLQKTMLAYGSIGQLLQLNSSDTFLYYDANRYLLTEKIGVNKDLLQLMHNRLDSLFRQADVAYVIPRDITDSWLHTLPALPHGLPWTILLLQEMLKNFPEIGFRAITSELGQSGDTIAAAIVPSGSPLQSFPDVVTLYMQEKHTLPKRMACEELRQELREAGMLAGNELIYALPKALDDFRFSWTDGNKTVLVRGN